MCLEEMIYSLPNAFSFYLESHLVVGDFSSLSEMGLCLSPPASSLLVRIASFLNVSLIVLRAFLNILCRSSLFWEQMAAVWNDELALGL